MLKIIFVFLFSVTLLGCSSSFESTTQVNDSAFLQLEGDFYNTQLILNDSTPFELNKSSVDTFTFKGKEVARFPISTGKHSIKILRSGKVIVNRIIFVSNSNTFEVVVP